MTVRDLADVDRMEPYVTRGGHVLIVGGGYIGLEAAAVARKKGLSVTLIEMADRILQRVACPETAAYLKELHEDKVVYILENTGLIQLKGERHVARAVLSTGQTLAVDFVIAGIGIAPNQEIAEAAGISCAGGIATNAMGETSAPGVWAAGDCATLPWEDKQIRLESVQNAIDQAEAVAKNMLGSEIPYDPKPWFWSDQYDMKLQIAGLNQGYTSIVTRQSADARSHWYYRGDTLISVDAMNDPRGYMVGKRLIEAGKSPDPSALANPDTELKALLRA